MSARRAKIGLIAGFLLLGASTSRRLGAEDVSPCKPEQWKDDIAAFENEDAAKAFSPGGVIFVGSSSIRLWDLAKWYPNMPVLNRGFGGSQICDSVYFADVLVNRHKPRLIIFYAGDNDIASGKTAEQVRRDFQAFVAAAHKPLPETDVVFISIKPSVLRWAMADKMREANRLIAADCEKDKHLHFVDVWPAMLGDDGLPRKELLREDGLHMTDAGYKIWVELLKPYLQPAEPGKNHEGTKDTK